MSLRTKSDIFKEVLVRNNRTTTDSFISGAILDNWFLQSHAWATSMYKWPFTEGRIQTTFTTGGGPGVDEWYFEGYKSDSFRLAQVGGKRLLKLNFEDYQILREEEPQANDRVFSDFGRVVYINPNIDASGTLVAYGQLLTAVDMTVDNPTTSFSDYDEDGNEAIVEKMSFYLTQREERNEAIAGGGKASAHAQIAQEILDRMWKRILDEQAMYQSHPDRGGMWKRFDVLKGQQQNEMWRRDQF